ncbi:hypothetical protein GE21DRAFT_1115698 [Neurospora crassa]|nr:hypothetical protein GE21DRAFT_1115698 [Neurospora crassa]
MVAQHRSMFLTGCLTCFIHTLTHSSSSRTSRTRELSQISCRQISLSSRPKVSVPESNLRSSKSQSPKRAVVVPRRSSRRNVYSVSNSEVDEKHEAEIEKGLCHSCRKKQSLVIIEHAWSPRELFVEREGDSSQLHRIF